MPSQQIPATPVVGGVTSRRHAKLLHHLFEGSNGGGANAPVKDLRIRRVVPPASAPPPDASPDPPAAAAKPVPAVQIQAQSTPPEPSAAAAAEDRDRKPILPRSKLVRDPASFGYRRLLPFLNQMAAKNGSDVSDGKNTQSETKVDVSTDKELDRSDSGLADESVDASQGVAALVDSVEPLAVEGERDGEMKDCCDTVNEEAKVVSGDLASSKPCVTRCTRSKFVHHPSSFSYKRMLPFLMENEISSLEEDRSKIRRVSEEDQIASEGSPEELDGAQVDRVLEEMTPISDGNCVVPIESAVAEVSLDGSSAAEVQWVAQEEVLASVGEPVSSDMSAVPATGQYQLAVPEESPEKQHVAEAETTVKEKEALKSDEKSVVMDSLELLAVKAGGDQMMKEGETKTVPADLASSKPLLKRCTRSRFVHHLSSFSYKRMLPFLMENDISSEEVNRAKFQRVPEEKQLTSDEGDDVLASGHHDLSISKDSSEVERIVEEIASAPYLLKGGQLQSTVTEVSLDDSTAEVQKVTQEVLASVRYPLCPDKGELSSAGNDALPSGPCHLAVSEDSPKESNAAEAERIVHGNAAVSDENSILDGRGLQSAVSEVSPQEDDTYVMEEVTQKQVPDTDGESLVKDQSQVCDSKKLLQDKAELSEVQECQSSEHKCSDVGFGSPTKTATVDDAADRHGAQKRHDSVASPDDLLLDVGLICKPSDPCLEKQCVSPKKLYSVNDGFSGATCLKKRALSPKRLSPKKGILKRHTVGCKGICMCLDCTVFRLRADRSFEFSRKQMQEADDIIGNLLEEVASLRSMVAKPSGQQEHIEETCQRASRVEEVARERQRQMLAELSAHCKIPGPRVKFAQYVDEKMASSPRCSNSSSCRRQPPL